MALTLQARDACPKSLPAISSAPCHHLPIRWAMKGRPLIVLLKENSGKRHYVVIVGYHTTEQQVLIDHPHFGRVKLAEEAFEQFWSRAETFFYYLAKVIHSRLEGR